MGRRGRMPRGPKSLIDKVRDIDPTFADEAYSLSDDDIKAKMLTMAKHRSEIEAAKKTDSDLKSKQMEVREANKTYSEPLKAIKLKTDLSLEILKDRGKI
jgi:hypothetical protein